MTAAVNSRICAKNSLVKLHFWFKSRSDRTKRPAVNSALTICARVVVYKVGMFRVLRAAQSPRFASTVAEHRKRDWHCFPISQKSGQMKFIKLGSSNILVPNVRINLFISRTLWNITIFQFLTHLLFLSRDSVMIHRRSAQSVTTKMMRHIK